MHKLPGLTTNSMNYLGMVVPKTINCNAAERIDVFAPFYIPQMGALSLNKCEWIALEGGQVILLIQMVIILVCFFIHNLIFLSCITILIF